MIITSNGNRLFPNTQLHCEERERSIIRGWFHFLACITIFPCLLISYLNIFVNTQQLNYWSFYVAFFNFMIIYVAHIISAFYHIGNLLPHQEILLQKTDIIGANCYVASSYLPMAILLFPIEVGTALLTTSGGVLGWNIHCIIHSKYGMHQPMYIILLQVLFSPFIYTHLTTEELIMNCTGIASLSGGAYF